MVMFVTGAGILQGWVPYFAAGVLLQEKDGAASGWLSSCMIGGVVLAGIGIWLLFNFGHVSKRRLYGVCLVLSGLMFPLLGLVGVFVSGYLVLQGLILAFVVGIPMAAVFLLPKALVADIADYDTLIRGEQREAMFYSTQNFFEKVTYALPPLLLSLVLQLGDSPENPLGIRLAPLLAGALALLGFVLWPRYRLPDTVNPETVAAAGLLPANS
jgi:GPH family glycoside/pentoside/hexuronide:cation symporter